MIDNLLGIKSEESDEYGGKRAKDEQMDDIYTQRFFAYPGKQGVLAKVGLYYHQRK